MLEFCTAVATSANFEELLLLKLNDPVATIKGLQPFKKINHPAMDIFAQGDLPDKLVKVLPLINKLIENNLIVTVHGSVVLEYLLNSIKQFSVVPHRLAWINSDIDLIVNYREDLAAILAQEQFSEKKQNYFFSYLDPTGTIDIATIVDESIGENWLILPAVVSTRLRLLIQKEGEAVLLRLKFNSKNATQNAAKFELELLVAQLMRGDLPFDLPAGKEKLSEAIQALSSANTNLSLAKITLTRLFFSRMVKQIEKHRRLFPGFLPKEHSSDLKNFFDSEWQELYFTYLLKISKSNYNPAYDDIIELIIKNLPEIAFILKNTDESTDSCKISTIRKILSSFFRVFMPDGFKPELLGQFISKAFGALIFSVLRKNSGSQSI